MILNQIRILDSFTIETQNNDNMTYGECSHQITAGLHLKHTTNLTQTQDSFTE